MFVASDSFSDLPDFHLEKLLLDSAMDAIPVYEYCKAEGIQPFIMM